MNVDHEIMKRYPNIELSYETIHHKKIPNHYDLCFAIPQSKKFIIWFTFYKDEDVCLLMELNRNKIISNISIITTSLNNSRLNLGTILYGSLITAPNKNIDFFTSLMEINTGSRLLRPVLKNFLRAPFDLRSIRAAIRQLVPLYLYKYLKR